MRSIKGSHFDIVKVKGNVYLANLGILDELVADPGFFTRGLRQPMIRSNFPENSMVITKWPTL